MVLNKNISGKAVPMPIGYAAGAAVSLLLTLIGTAVIVNAVLGGKMAERSIGYGTITILLAASAFGAWLAAALIKRRWVIVCLGAGAIYYLTLLGITALFFGGQYHGMGVTALVILAGCGAVGLLGLKGEGMGRKHRKKYRHR